MKIFWMLTSRLLIREFVDIHNVVTNLTRAKKYLGYFLALGFWVIG